MIHLDTHVVVWLYDGRLDLLSGKAQSLLEQEALAISPMVVLELEYMFEIGRATIPGKEFLDDLAGRVGLSVSDVPFAAVVSSARGLTWTRDPFDRLIVGQSIAEGVPLLTRDQTIRAEHRDAVW